MLNVRILDGQGQDIYAHNKEFKDGSNGLIVASRPYNYYEFKRFDFISDVYGQSMNIGSVYGDTPELVHNGIDSTLWTGANVVGTSPVFNSTGQAYEGTRSIYWNNPVQGSIFQLSKGSNFVFSGYLAVSFWVYVDANYQITDLISFYGYNTSTGQQIGSKVYLQNYFNVATLDVWQKVTIPLDDLNINGLTITSFRFKHEVRNGPASPQIYIDKIQVEQAANNQGLFYVKPDLQTWFFCQEVMFFISDVYDSTSLNSTCNKLDYKKILNEAQLDSGVNMTVKRRDRVRYQLNFKNLGDFFKIGGHVAGMGYDGSSETWLTLELPFKTPILLQSEYEDIAEIYINDNLSGLTNFSCVARGYVEYKIDSDIGMKNVY